MTAQNHYSQPDQLLPKLQGHQPNPNHSVLVYGPQGCGKTRNTAELLRHFNLQRVIELEAHGTGEIPNEGVLVLTSAAPETLWIEDWPIFSFEDAMRQIVEASAEKGEYTTLPEGVDFIWATGDVDAIPADARRYRVVDDTTAPAILRSAATAIDDRAALRDCPTGERSMARCVAAFNAITGHTLTETEGWHFMSILKLARATAGGHHLDDHTDHAGYAALAGESAERQANQ